MKKTILLNFISWIRESLVVAIIIFGVIVLRGVAFCGEIQLASRDGDLAKVAALLRKNPELVNNNDATNPPPLLMAIAHNRIKVAELLLANNADVNAKGPSGTIFCNPTSLDLAAYYGFKDEVELLLKYHANINATNGYGQTPLHVAIHNGCTEVVRLLLDNKANVNIKNNENKTPLHVAVEWWREEVVKWLIADHADINAKDKEGQTPLHIAVQQGRANIVKMLLAAGADVNVKDDKGQTPLQLAVAADKADIADMLRKNSE